MRAFDRTLRHTAGVLAVAVYTLVVGFGCGSSSQQITASAASNPTPTSGGILGQVSTTQNSQVASYVVTSPKDGMLTVLFGTTTSYNQSTSTQPVVAGNPVTVYVAGMLPATTYHVQASVRLADGSALVDVDRTFTTGSPPPQFNLQLGVNGSGSPQPGIEMLDVYGATGTGAVAVDLSGRLLWSYYLPDGPPHALLFPVNLLPNGHILFVVEGLSQANYNGSSTASGLSFLREIDLAGNVIRQLTTDQLNQKLVAAGFNITLWAFHHDVLSLPNGHLILLCNTIRQVDEPFGASATTPVLGDVIVDLDANLQPVWVWNTFDHLDINRRPYLFPDWTHANALLYSASDGQLLVSLRHQNWIVKLDYRDGQGNGDVIWKLGEGGNFTLKGGVDPTDWFYAQHGPSFFSSNTSGVFSIGVMDNGDDRRFPQGVTCGAAASPTCLYTTVPILQVDEGAKTATIIYHKILPGTDYSYFGGNVEQLDNGDLKYTLCTLSAPPLAKIREETLNSVPSPVWQGDLNAGAAVFYRSVRLASLYPGTQWQ